MLIELSSTFGADGSRGGQLCAAAGAELHSSLGRHGRCCRHLVCWRGGDSGEIGVVVDGH